MHSPYSLRAATAREITCAGVHLTIEITYSDASSLRTLYTRFALIAFPETVKLYLSKPLEI